MTVKRFTDNGIEEIENQSFTDNLTEKTYWIDNGLDEIVELLNKFNDENEQLKEDIGLLKYQNELLSDELEQCKAVINKKWGEYLKKKELEE